MKSRSGSFNLYFLFVASILIVLYVCFLVSFPFLLILLFLQDRRHALEACIVRIMKSRRSLDHQHLMIEVGTCLISFFSLLAPFLALCACHVVCRVVLCRTPCLSPFLVHLSSLLCNSFPSPFLLLLLLLCRSGHKAVTSSVSS